MRPAAIVFDLLGTLLDIGSLQSAVAAYCTDPAAFVSAWREKQIAYTFASTIMRRYENFDVITARALAYTAAKYQLSDRDRACESLADSWRTAVAPYPDVRPALDELRGLGLRCVVLTNATSASAQTALHAAGLADAIDTTLSVDAARTYKPDARVYALATTQLCATPDRLLFVTSNGWDATGASEFGIPVAWCNRAAAPAETFGTPPVWTIASLNDLAALVKRL